MISTEKMSFRLPPDSYQGNARQSSHLAAAEFSYFYVKILSYKIRLKIQKIKNTYSEGIAAEKMVLCKPH